ncbi:hypothetical protein EOA23_12155 [Mesorhizobium sp. M2A.F.Ca.ET.042.01.1.1]|uniref:hypothetical protein n=1 Tax=Mesorhizobium sp. M2A.F.Ca.ET.042.01.1.1 TaxID=2496745 RepID=UPI000FCAD598|nr:hypothetical protein [Mesorhizobium sp. M2A.F.Ca.ET.042.01.1.1]RUX30382.1 hypothetical protein EOA23_12155 [Mesorhizobium sp. M2A.F.Ca.ET.042.01.1.1]
MTYTAPVDAAGDAELLALRAALRNPSTIPSLARTFPHPDKRHWARESPLPVRLTRATRRLAHNGAMAPEGCTAGEMERVRTNHRIRIDVLKDIMKTLWSFRLLGWLPSDTLYLTWSQVEEFVAAGTQRPADTLDLIPDWFTRRHTADELKTFRDGGDA